MSRWVCVSFEFILVTIQFSPCKNYKQKGQVFNYTVFVIFSAWRQHDITCRMIENCLIQLVSPCAPPPQ